MQLNIFCTVKLETRTGKSLHAQEIDNFCLEVKNDLLHFFLIKAVKTKRKRLTLDEKLEIIKLSEQGLSNVQIGRQREMHESSVRKIIKDKTEINWICSSLAISIMLQIIKCFFF